MAMEDSTYASPGAYGPDIARVLIPRDRIASRVRELACAITDAYGEEEITVLAALTGSLMFLCDLIRHLPLRVRLDFVKIRSYPGQATAPTEPAMLMPPERDLAGRHVLIVDDILDSGQTIGLLREHVASAGAASVRTCVLLSKRRDDLPRRRPTDFVGFDIEDRFVVGYGLDHDDLYRNLPDICLLKALDGGTGR